jgi:restriction system protein
VAEVSKERFGLLHQKTLEVLSIHPEGLHVNKVVEELESLLPATPFEDGIYENSGLRRYPVIIRFSTIGLVKAGWITKESGIWKITEEGKAAITRNPNPLALRMEVIKLYRIWKSSRPAGGEIVEYSDDVEDVAGDYAAAVSIEVAENNAFTLVEQFLGRMNPYEFQNLVKALIEGMGYHVSWVAPPGKDGGIDIVAFHDHLGAEGPRIKIQVKRTQGAASVESIRSFLGILSERDDIGLYVCLGGFTSDAVKEARTHSSKRLTLIDSQKLFDLWVEHYDKLPHSSRIRLPVKPVYYLDI